MLSHLLSFCFFLLFSTYHNTAAAANNNNPNAAADDELTASRSLSTHLSSLPLRIQTAQSHLTHSARSALSVNRAFLISVATQFSAASYSGFSVPQFCLEAIQNLTLATESCNSVAELFDLTNSTDVLPQINAICSSNCSKGLSKASKSVNSHCYGVLDLEGAGEELRNALLILNALCITQYQTPFFDSPDDEKCAVVAINSLRRLRNALNDSIADALPSIDETMLNNTCVPCLNIFLEVYISAGGLSNDSNGDSIHWLSVLCARDFEDNSFCYPKLSQFSSSFAQLSHPSTTQSSELSGANSPFNYACSSCVRRVLHYFSFFPPIAGGISEFSSDFLAPLCTRNAQNELCLSKIYSESSLWGGGGELGTITGPGGDFCDYFHQISSNIGCCLGSFLSVEENFLNSSFSSADSSLLFNLSSDFPSFAADFSACNIDFSACSAAAAVKFKLRLNNFRYGWANNHVESVRTALIKDLAVSLGSFPSEIAINSVNTGQSPATIVNEANRIVAAPQGTTVSITISTESLNTANIYAQQLSGYTDEVILLNSVAGLPLESRELLTYGVDCDLEGTVSVQNFQLGSAQRSRFSEFLLVFIVAFATLFLA